MYKYKAFRDTASYLVGVHNGTVVGTKDGIVFKDISVCIDTVLFNGTPLLKKVSHLISFLTTDVFHALNFFRIKENF